LSQAERRFHLSDAIVLVVAAALMLSADRAVGKLWTSHISTSGTIPSFDAWETRRMAWTLGLALLNLAMLCSTLARRVDRSRLRGGAPGLFVHAAVATAILAGVASWASHSSLGAMFEGRPGFHQPQWRGELLFGLHISFRRDAAIAVLAGWLALVIVGRWNPERTWDDRLGRLLGLLWLFLFVGDPLFALLP
jgi:hypothetical protein